MTQDSTEVDVEDVPPVIHVEANIEYTDNLTRVEREQIAEQGGLNATQAESDFQRRVEQFLIRNVLSSQAELISAEVEFSEVNEG